MQSAIMLPAIAGAAALVLVAVASALVARRRRRRATPDTASWSVTADDTGQRTRLFSLPPHVDADAASHPGYADPDIDDAPSGGWDPSTADTGEVVAGVSAGEPASSDADEDEPWWLDSLHDRTPDDALADATAARDMDEASVNQQ